MRITYYAGASVAVAAATLFKAFNERPNFYSACVYLAQSSACLLVLSNLCLVLACGFFYGLQRLFYGPLRPLEVEMLYERGWYAILDLCLALPSVREDVGARLLSMFLLLMAAKVWAWIGEGRVEILEQQPPTNPRLFHTRLASSLTLSMLFSMWMLKSCIMRLVSAPGPGMMVTFTFEFAVLGVFTLFTLCRYGLAVTHSLIEKRQIEAAVEERKREIRAEREQQRRAFESGQEGVQAPPTEEEEPIEVDENEVNVPGWEVKRRYLFVLEIVADFAKLTFLLVFLTISIAFGTLPMHTMREVYMTFASFTKRVGDYAAYRQATHNMNAKYPDATTEEIRGDTCIVCREAMVAWDPQQQTPRDEGLRAKKLPCNHILHLRCLKAWLERQQVCPTCRRPVLTPPPQQPNVEGAGPAGEGRQAPARNGPRLFNLGPFRIGFLRGRDMENLLDQLRGQERPQGADAAVPAQGNQSPAPASQTATRSSNSSSSSTRAQLARIEERLQRESARLSQEVQQIRTLQRMEANIAQMRASIGQARHQMAGTGGPNVAPPPDPSYGMVEMHSDGQLMSQSSRELPAGLTLPEGWTLMPLRRVDDMAPPTNAHSSISTPVQPPANGNPTPIVQISRHAMGSASGDTNSRVAPPIETAQSQLVPPTTASAESSRTPRQAPASPHTPPNSGQNSNGLGSDGVAATDTSQLHDTSG
ncbi:hypothetical protein K470DRAFT_260433 [Piedraia hortae CBS 480.64]|uniref:RING-type E3 ubiquitin transferase n=1 Tax=Piedraia hortae CBS 480.64 TaxID=1314780 RepID=A0A6A7BRB1_9PEZI|nr:hypothetical protein K470DRAFT_260433 [Piedraia hortae CBS 480.64]